MVDQLWLEKHIEITGRDKTQGSASQNNNGKIPRDDWVSACVWTQVFITYR